MKKDNNFFYFEFQIYFPHLQRVQFEIFNSDKLIILCQCKSFLQPMKNICSAVFKNGKILSSSVPFHLCTISKTTARISSISHPINNKPIHKSTPTYQFSTWVELRDKEVKHFRDLEMELI